MGRRSRLREKIPHIHIRTSLIVGFPSETEEQFEELVQFIQDYPLNHVGIFKYSQEEGTAAGRMTDQIAEEVKERRHQKVASIQQQMSENLNAQLIGQQLEVVVESYHPESELLLVGRHAGQCPEIDGQVILNDWRKVDSFGERYLVEITDCAQYDLIGRVVQKLHSPLKLFKS